MHKLRNFIANDFIVDVNYENFHWHNNFGRLLNKYLKLIPIIIDIGIRKASSIPKNIKPLLNSEASKLLQ